MKRADAFKRKEPLNITTMTGLARLAGQNPAAAHPVDRCAYGNALEVNCYCMWHEAQRPQRPAPPRKTRYELRMEAEELEYDRMVNSEKF